MMRIIIPGLMLTVLTTALSAVEWRPLPATLVKTDGSQVQALIFSATVEDVTYSTPEAPNATGSLKQKNVARIDYDRLTDPDFNRGIGALRSQEWDKAIRYFEEARQKPYQYQAEQSARNLASAYEGKGQPAKGAEAIEAFLTVSPQHPDKPDLLARMADLHLQAEQVEQAQAMVDRIKGLGPAFGSDAEVLSLHIRARIAKQQDKMEEAIQLLREGLEKAQGRRKSSIGGELLTMLSEHGSEDDVLNVAKQLFYVPGDPTDTARIHFRAAEVYEGKGDWKRAFDHYLVGVTMPGVEASVRNRSYGELLQLTSIIEKNEEIPLEVKQQYRTAASRL